MGSEAPDLVCFLLHLEAFRAAARSALTRADMEGVGLRLRHLTPRDQDNIS